MSDGIQKRFEKVAVREYCFDRLSDACLSTHLGICLLHCYIVIGIGVDVIGTGANVIGIWVDGIDTDTGVDGIGIMWIL